MLAGLLAGVGGSAPANAVQATGHEVAAWSNGWSWTYATSFRYVADGTDVTINENVTYSVVGPETFNGYDAYRLNINGTITGGSGSTVVDGVGTAQLKNFSGTVNGHRYVRRSDLAVLQEFQHQHLVGTASVGIISTGITADIDLTLTPSPSWKTHDFPLNVGDNWQLDEQIAYTGGFVYDAGSLGGSGSSPFNGTLPFVAPANVNSATISAGGNPSLATDRIYAVNGDGSMSDEIWWSPTFKNDAKEILILPLDGAQLTINRTLTSALTPTPAVGITESITPSLTCAGGQITVAGQLSSNANNVPVTIRLDKSQLPAGGSTSTTALTANGGAYSGTLTVPVEADGLSKNGSRANWGVVVSTASGSANAATVVVTHEDCSSLAYTGDTSAATGSTATVKAKLTNLGSGTASGRLITFALSGGASVSATTGPDGVATTTIPVAGNPRSATITASYAGSPALAAASTVTPFAVTQVATTTVAVPSASPVIAGDPVSFTATVTPALPGNPGGSVQFLVDGGTFGAAVPVSGGTATSAVFQNLPLGNHTITANYLGDVTYGPSTASFALLVRNPPLSSTTTSTVTPSTSVYGQPVTLSSTVTGSGGTPTGSVVFSDGSGPLGTAFLNGSGQATLLLDDLNVGSHSIVATYSGDDVYDGGAAAPKTASVSKADVDVEIQSSDTTTVSGEAVNFTANLSAVAPSTRSPNGSVQLVIDGNNVGAPVAIVNGTASFPPVTSLLAGNHTVAAAYAGTANYEAGSDSLSQQVSEADTLTSVVATPSPSSEGQNIAITANVAAVAPGSGSPTGTVVFTANGITIGAAPLQSGPGGSQVTVNVDDLAPGAYSIVASYSGGTGYGASDSQPLSHTVLDGAAIVATEISVDSSENPSTFGQLITFSAHVDAADSSAPAGTVQFSVDGTDFGSPEPVNGQGNAESAALFSPDPGDHTVIAEFVPAPGFSGSGAILTQTVAAAGVDLGVTSTDSSSDYGQGVSFTATVGSQQLGTDNPTGFVQFAVDGQPVGNAVELVDGAATSPSVANLTPGTHAVGVVYSGDAYFVPATTSLTQSVAKIGTTTTINASTTTPTYGQAVVLTATVAPANGALGAPGGTVTFVDGSTPLGTVAVSQGSGNNGTASLSVSGLGGGAHAIKAVYSGSPSFSASSSAPKTVTVAKRATTINAEPAVVKLLPLGLPLGQLRVTLVSGGSPVGGVPITFKVGAITACVSTTNSFGVATCSATHLLVQIVLALGYKASFAGDANYLPSTANGAILR